MREGQNWRFLPFGLLIIPVTTGLCMGGVSVGGPQGWGSWLVTKMRHDDPACCGAKGRGRLSLLEDPPSCSNTVRDRRYLIPVPKKAKLEGTAGSPGTGRRWERGGSSEKYPTLLGGDG